MEHSKAGGKLMVRCAWWNPIFSVLKKPDDLNKQVIRQMSGVSSALC